jgi:hypothetical protein
MTKWISDSNGNRASIERWGDEAGARRALASLENCSYCNDCSGCADCSYCNDCSGCADCSYCSYCSDCAGCSYRSRCAGCADLEDAAPVEAPAIYG